MWSKPRSAVAGPATRPPSSPESGASMPKSHSYQEGSLLKHRRLHRVAAQLGNVCLETGPAKQRGDLRSQSPGRGIALSDRITENIPNLLLHAPAVSPGSPPEAHLHLVFKISHDNLGHQDFPDSMIAYQGPRGFSPKPAPKNRRSTRTRATPARSAPADCVAQPDPPPSPSPCRKTNRHAAAALQSFPVRRGIPGAHAAPPPPEPAYPPQRKVPFRPDPRAKSPGAGRCFRPNAEGPSLPPAAKCS